MQRFFLSALAAMLLICPATAQEHKTTALPPPQDPPVLEVHGRISNVNTADAAHFDLNMLETLPVIRMETKTAVTDGVHRFDGFLMRDLLKLVGAEGSTVIASALNDYVIEFEAEEFDRFDVLVAYRMDDELLLPNDKGPLWIVYPRDQHAELQDIRYDYRWVWQLRRLDVR
ncbi:oxidoreductase [Devosia sp. YIM 151766]|uniref:molybdopterin-dependent oxidoreductase n=1 Tax=Devosia sp. YIM 151766 TaxID=3017325 RepID=UPI00255CEDBF|nr:oxidoreductase [Devosia sp. YIM 151766]WIY52237.1 oxidoreductase [Devosia sp. YIM 151766]